MDLLAGRAVDLRLSVRQPREDGQSVLMDARRQGAGVEDGGDVGEVPPVLLVGIEQDHVHIGGRDAQARDALDDKRIAGHIERAETVAEGGFVRTAGQQRSQRHVAAHAGEAVEIGGSHVFPMYPADTLPEHAV